MCPACRSFPWVGPLSSTDSAADTSALFVRFFGTMEPSDSPKACTSVVRPQAFSDRSAAPSTAGVFGVAETFGVSRFPCREFPRMPRVLDSVAFRGGWRWTSSLMGPSLSPYKVGTPGEVISELHGWPACAPVNASPPRLPASAHDSGSRWLAIPFLCGSCIRYSLPALTGAFMASPELSAPRIVRRAVWRIPWSRRVCHAHLSG
jgi:hypothetical protein